jgi:hypothetical protein
MEVRAWVFPNLIFFQRDLNDNGLFKNMYQPILFKLF